MLCRRLHVNLTAATLNVGTLAPLQRVSLQGSRVNINSLIALAADTPSNRIVVVQGKFAITKSWRGKYIASPTSLSIDNCFSV